MVGVLKIVISNRYGLILTMELVDLTTKLKVSAQAFIYIKTPRARLFMLAKQSAQNASHTLQNTLPDPKTGFGQGNRRRRVDRSRLGAGRGIGLIPNATNRELTIFAA